MYNYIEKELWIQGNRINKKKKEVEPVWTKKYPKNNNNNNSTQFSSSKENRKEKRRKRETLTKIDQGKKKNLMDSHEIIKVEETRNKMPSQGKFKNLVDSSII